MAQGRILHRIKIITTIRRIIQFHKKRRISKELPLNLRQTITIPIPLGTQSSSKGIRRHKIIMSRIMIRSHFRLGIRRSWTSFKASDMGVIIGVMGMIRDMMMMLIMRIWEFWRSQRGQKEEAERNLITIRFHMMIQWVFLWIDLDSFRKIKVVEIEIRRNIAVYQNTFLWFYYFLLLR